MLTELDGELDRERGWREEGLLVSLAVWELEGRGAVLATDVLVEPGKDIRKLPLELFACEGSEGCCCCCLLSICRRANPCIIRSDTLWRTT